MPMTTTHALLPVAAAVALARRPIPWTLVMAAAVAAAAPDLDGVFRYIWHVPKSSIYSHRGAAHSLFVALVAGFAAALFHKRLGVRPLTAGVVISTAMASHGLLDMMTDAGRPVAYLWPLSSVRLFADWRPIHSSPVHMAHLVSEGFTRLLSDLRQLIIPMFAAAIAIRGARSVLSQKARRRESQVTFDPGV